MKKPATYRSKLSSRVPTGGVGTWRSHSAPSPIVPASKLYTTSTVLSSGEALKKRNFVWVLSNFRGPAGSTLAAIHYLRFFNFQFIKLPFSLSPPHPLFAALAVPSVFSSSCQLLTAHCLPLLPLPTAYCRLPTASLPGKQRGRKICRRKGSFPPAAGII